MKIKVCGMKHNTAEVAALGPDYLGFIFWAGSPREFTGSPVRLPDTMRKVGVFVDAPLDFITDSILTHDLHFVQLHGSESPAYCKDLWAKVEGQALEGIIKVFSVGEAFDFNRLAAYEEVCHYYLFDTRGELPGGNGLGFNWEVLQDYPSAKPYFLSGGIGPGDTFRLEAFFQKPEARYCHALDINSRFEIEPGLKDTGALLPFIHSIRNTSL